MSFPEKDRLAAEVMDCWVAFQECLSADKRRYPIQQFRAFWAIAKSYAELTKDDPLIHRSVAGAVNGNSLAASRSLILSTTTARRTRAYSSTVYTS